MCDSGGNGGNYGNECVVGGISDVVGGNGGVVGDGGGITGSFSNGSTECVVGGVSGGSNVGDDSGDNNNSDSGKLIVWYKL